MAESIDKVIEKFGDSRLDLTRLLSMLYVDLEQQLARADTKANLVLTANSILLAASVNVMLTHARAVAGTDALLTSVVALIPALLLSGLAVNYALSVAYPRDGRAVAGLPASEAAASELFSSSAIASQTREAYVSVFMDTEIGQVKEEVLRGIHAKAAILQVKFKLVRRGILSTVAAFAAWSIFMVVTVVLQRS